MDERKQNQPSSQERSESAAFEALGFLLDYMFVRPRFLDGVNAPPLFDRTDFAEHVGELTDARAAQWTHPQQVALQWLADYCDARLRLD